MTLARIGRAEALLARLRARHDAYVTALKPSPHRAWLATMRGRLEPVTLRTGEVVEAARTALETQHFGLRVLATTRDDWTTAQIIEAYRGQAHAERAFRDLKDPWVGAFRPQYHWTDQKLVVHALLVMLGLLLGRVHLRRARQRVGFAGSLRRLIQTLGQIRESTVVHHHDGPGRPRVTTHVVTTDETLRPLGQALGAWPASPRPVGVYTTRRR